ncbi:hypothetical protein J6590_035683 [Homalodisca vitripennis]|nr:hypothetical protein J6590_035683 [Homalodisca vitripennis]
MLARRRNFYFSPMTQVLPGTGGHPIFYLKRTESKDLYFWHFQSTSDIRASLKSKRCKCFVFSFFVVDYLWISSDEHASRFQESSLGQCQEPDIAIKGSVDEWQQTNSVQSSYGNCSRLDYYNRYFVTDTRLVADTAVSRDNRIKQRRAWLLLGWVVAERSCPYKQPACPAITMVLLQNESILYGLGESGVISHTGAISHNLLFGSAVDLDCVGQCCSLSAKSTSFPSVEISSQH